MTHGPLNGAMADFVYDSRRRLTQAGTMQYVYDAENHRIGINGTRFVVNSQPALSQVLVKTAADGARTFYVYGLGLIGEESAAGYKAYHFDFRGSTVALSDESGAVLERFSYSAYGVLLSGDASVTPFLFNGMYGVMTDANGLYHMRARFYSAEIRRFLNRDVLLGGVARGQSLNRFAFVAGRPVSFVDPFGLRRIDINIHYNMSSSILNAQVMAHVEKVFEDCFKNHNTGNHDIHINWKPTTQDDEAMSLGYSGGTWLFGADPTQVDIYLGDALTSARATGYTIGWRVDINPAAIVAQANRNNWNVDPQTANTIAHEVGYHAMLQTDHYIGTILSMFLGSISDYIDSTHPDGQPYRRFSPDACEDICGALDLD